MSKQISKRRGRLLSKLSALSAAVAAAGFLSAVPVMDSVLSTGLFSDNSVLAQDRAGGGQRPPPSTRQAQTLSQNVFRIIEQVIELRDNDDYVGARRQLDNVKQMYDNNRLNDYEKFTMWLFYASIDQAEENYDAAIASYNEILRLENITPEQREQALQVLGQLYYVQEKYPEAIDIMKRYLEVAQNPSPDILLRIGSAYYQLEQFAEGLPYVLQNIEAERARGNQVAQSTYSLLRALHLSLDDFRSARQVQREMVVLYNDINDWPLLGSIYGQLEEFEKQLETYYVGNVMGYLDSESELITLAYQLFNADNPWGAAKVVEKGMEAGVIDKNQNNLSFLSQAYQIAREDAKAVPPLIEAAEMGGEDAGEMYARLGRLYINMYEFDKAADAFDEAFRMGNLGRPDQIRITQARALLEAKEFDRAITVLREAARDERSADTARVWINHVESEKAREESLEERRKQYEGYFL